MVNSRIINNLCISRDQTLLFTFPPSSKTHHLLQQSMASWINDDRTNILERHRNNYEGVAGMELKKLVKDIVQELRVTDGEPLPAKIKKVK
jgi:hypothetical protein